MTINDMTATARIRKALAHCRTVATVAAAEANGDCERTPELLEQRARRRRGFKRALLTLAIAVTADPKRLRRTCLVTSAKCHRNHLTRCTSLRAT